MPRFLKYALIALVALFALIGLAFTAVYLAMQFGFTNVRGSIDERNRFFLDGAAAAPLAQVPAEPCVDDHRAVCAWNETPEWAVVAGGLRKDAAVIEQVSRETGVDARLIAASAVPEQFRFFTAEREVFKRYFEPLKILGSLSQFSLGVTGIKQETAREIEEHARDATSPFYPGPSFAALIAYPPGADEEAMLYARLTDADDHYYSYLYTALYLREVMAQWEQAGFPIEDRPDILVTLFNIGFDRSHPHASPAAGGAPITVGGQTYPFGTLGGLFYESDELADVFPH